ncbi:MAG: tryptophan-rich sensory protein [Rhodothermales bacterium]
MNGSLLVNIVLMYAILIGINIPASFFGIDFNEEEARQRLWFEPPGYVIPLAWFVLFTLLGTARYLLLKAHPGTGADWLILILAVVCASYAYYTIGLARLTGVSALWFGLIGNLVVIGLALVAAYGVGALNARAGLLILPVALWTTYATAIVLGEMRVQGLV